MSRESLKTALGTAVGAGLGLVSGLGVLAATGGSDSFNRILFSFVGIGAVGGLAIGSGGCSR